ncbi:MAG: hypothetical protein ACREL7_15310 [Longimicrobiales bacterium]
MRTHSFVVCVAVSVALTIPTWVQAQDCGRDCLPCAGYGWEGSFFDPDGSEDMRCPQILMEDCDKCGINLVAAEDVDVADLISALRSQNSEQWASLVIQFRERLLLHPERRIVAVLGAGCSASRVDSVVFLEEETVDRLRVLGLRDLRDYLRAENQD